MSGSFPLVPSRFHFQLIINLDEASTVSDEDFPQNITSHLQLFDTLGGCAAVSQFRVCVRRSVRPLFAERSFEPLRYFLLASAPDVTAIPLGNLANFVVVLEYL